jgi:hypothetical protein
LVVEKRKGECKRSAEGGTRKKGESADEDYMGERERREKRMKRVGSAKGRDEARRLKARERTQVNV